MNGSDEPGKDLVVDLEGADPAIEPFDGTNGVVDAEVRQTLGAPPPVVVAAEVPAPMPRPDDRFVGGHRVGDVGTFGAVDDTPTERHRGSKDDVEFIDRGGVEHDVSPVERPGAVDLLHHASGAAEREVGSINSITQVVTDLVEDRSNLQVNGETVIAHPEPTQAPGLLGLVPLVVDETAGDSAPVLGLDADNAIKVQLQPPDTGHLSSESRPRLLEQIADEDNLQRAWLTVLDNDLADGELSRAGERFSKDADERLASISRLLLTEQWQPQPLFEVVLPDDDGRELHIPSIPDRIVERAIAHVIVPLFDPWFSPRSFAYRPGLGVTEALRCVVEDRDSGLRWVVRADIRDCFPTLSRTRLAERLAEQVNDARVLTLIEALLERPERTASGKLTPTATGVPQGAPLSPLFANIVLDEIDRALHRGGWSAVRFADDLLITTESRVQAEKALQTLAMFAAGLGQTLADEKASITCVDSGLAFLGEDIGPRYPQFLDDARLKEPERKVLYVDTEGALIRSEKGQYVVTVNRQDVLKAPTSLVGSMVTFGNVGLSAGARSTALRTGCVVTFLSRRGQLLGWLDGPALPTASLRRTQYAVSDDPSFAADIARRFLTGKLRNMRALLLRYGTGTDVANVCERLQTLVIRLGEFDEVASLMGVEGSATSAYFSALDDLLPEGVTFPGRVRRPPTDPVNACLSFGYTLLTAEAVGAIAAAGLDPVVGFLHADQAARPSAALDLMEEFRPLIVDTVVLDMFRRKMLTNGHFRHEGNAVLLNDAARKKFLDRFERRMLTPAFHSGSGKKVTYRRMLLLQARNLARAIEHRRPRLYEPVWWRE